MAPHLSFVIRLRMIIGGSRHSAGQNRMMIESDREPS